MNYPAHVLPVNGYPAPRGVLLTPLLCSYAAIVHQDSVSFKDGHVSVTACAEFGHNPLNDGRMALCFGRNVPLLYSSYFLQTPAGEVLAIEVDLSKSPDMLYIWTFANGTKTYLDSVQAIANGNIINGYQRMVEFDYVGAPAYPGDPNYCRLKVRIDGVVRFNFIYDIPAQLWGGKAKGKMWITSQGGNALFNTQAATLMATTCNTQFILPLKRGDDHIVGEESGDALEIAVHPNPSRQEWIHVATTIEATYKLVDQNGKVLREGSLPRGVSPILVDDLAKGIYMIEVRSQGEQKCRRVLLE